MTEHLKILIQILSDGQFHSGEEIGTVLGLTRSAVWKLVKQFPDWDLEVESRTNKGYRIPGGVDLLDAVKIRKYVDLQQIDILDEIASTMDYVKSSKGGMRACFAEKQTAGRGRFGRRWLSPYAKNINLSVLYTFQKDLSQLSGLSLAIAVAIVESLQDYGIQEKIQLKWPNDIFCQNKKLSGILIELSGETHGTCNAIIGIGLNVHMPSTDYSDIATILGKIPDRNKIAGLLLKHIVAAIKLFEQQGFEPFREKWQSYDITYGQPVKIISPIQEISGIGQGIDEQGFFLLEDANGIISKFSSGEVSLRI